MPRPRHLLRGALALIRVAGLVVVTWSTARGWDTEAGLRLGGSVVATVVAVVGWVGWLTTSSSSEVLAGLAESVGVTAFSGAEPRTLLPRTLLASSLLLLGVGGGILVGSEPNTASSAYAFVAVAVAAGGLAPRSAVCVVAATELAAVVSILLGPGRPTAAIAYGAGLLAAALAGANRAQAALRAEQTELLLVETQRASSERSHAAALEERGRIARDVHDLLAHSLAGLGLQLEAAALLLADGRADEARAHVTRAQDLAREGAAETRRALRALRGDAIDLASVLAEQLAAYRSDVGAEATLDLDLAVTPSAEAAVTAARVLQEVLTNATRHAPGATISGLLVSDAAGLRLEITDDGPAPGRTRQGGGSGYGLVGIRERAALAGGTVEAGAYGRGWRVCLTLPA